MAISHTSLCILQILYRRACILFAAEADSSILRSLRPAQRACILFASANSSTRRRRSPALPLVRVRRRWFECGPQTLFKIDQSHTPQNLENNECNKCSECVSFAIEFLRCLSKL